jgi:hypothetical protein
MTINKGDPVMAQTIEQKSPIQALKKVTLLVNAGTQPDGNDLNPKSSTFQVIFGLGIEGLTPFEFLLSNQSEGDTFSLKLHPNDVCKTFQHITLPAFDFPESTESVFYKFQVIKVEDASSREVIKAMAELSSCSGSCECCDH